MLKLFLLTQGIIYTIGTTDRSHPYRTHQPLLTLRTLQTLSHPSSASTYQPLSLTPHPSHQPDPHILILPLFHPTYTLTKPYKPYKPHLSLTLQPLSYTQPLP
jgi:hypothetical protein